MDEFGMMGLSSLAELNYMRLQAMDLFERCLTEGKPDSLKHFIDRQISEDPPPLPLLREVAEDLHERLMGLHEYYLETWDRTLLTLQREFGLPFDQHRLSAPFDRFERDSVLQSIRTANTSLNSEAETALHKLLDTSLETATQLRSDIAMTERLYVYISDWVAGLSATVGRRFWAEGRDDHYRSSSVH
jgi:hypothetical protein